MTGKTSPETPEALHASVSVDCDLVEIRSLTIEDRTLASLLARTAEADWIDLVARSLRIGATGLATMGVGLDIGEIDSRVRASVESANNAGMEAVGAMVERADSAMRAALDPESNDSVVSRVHSAFGQVRDEFLAGVDPDRRGSHTARLLGRLDEMLGPEGLLINRLEAALDPHGENTGIAKTFALVETRLTEIRDLVSEGRGRRDEAQAGTRKGLEFEDELEERLRAIAEPIGALVERTSNQCGDLNANAKVGDFLIELADGTRVVVEAKNSQRIGLLGNDGMLAELDRAAANRTADFALCVSANEAFPAEVGSFGVYGNRILLVDDDTGTLLRVALRWVTVVASMRSGSGDIDPVEISDGLERIRHLAQRFSTNRRTLSDIASNVSRVRDSLDDMRSDLLDLVDEMDRRLRSGRTAPVLDLHREVG